RVFSVDASRRDGGICPKKRKGADMTTTLAPFTVELPDHRFDPRWERLPGIKVDGPTLSVQPGDYFFRLESTGWRVIDWEIVAQQLLSAEETSDEALEQKALRFIEDHVRITHDPPEVLEIAWKVYSYLFPSEHLPILYVPGITTE